MLSDEIRTRRKQLGLTQVELGEKLGVSGNTVARWERGEVTPDAPPMLRLALEQLSARAATARRLKKTARQAQKTRARIERITATIKAGGERRKR
jgi:transcriptional regulator with XRE-family HTH domain